MRFKMGMVQAGGDSAVQAAGHAATQTARYFSTQTAGDISTQTAGEFSTQRGGTGTVQIIREWDDVGAKTHVRVITDAEADTWWRFEDGDWRLCTDGESAEADRRTK